MTTVVRMPDGTLVNMPDTLDPMMGARLRAYNDSQIKNPFLRNAKSEASDVGDASDMAVTSALNLVPGIWSSVKDFLTGGATPKSPGPAKLSPSTIADLQPGPMGEGAINAVKGADTALENAAPTVHNVLHHTLRVGGDVADVMPALGLGKTAVGAVGEGIDALNNARRAATLPITSMDDALDAVGYRNLPSKTDGSTGAKVGESITGTPQLASAQTLSNQAVTDRLAMHEAGVDPFAYDELNYDAIRSARKAGPGKVYDAAHDALPATLTQDTTLQNAIKGVGDTTSQLPRSPDVDGLKNTMLNQPEMTRDQLFSNIQQARDRAARFFASDKPDDQAMGDAYQQLANAYEDFVGRKLDHPDSPVKLTDWQNARTAFAKSYAVEAALQGTHVRASTIAALQRKNPQQLTGGLQLIAEQANRNPLSTGFGPTTMEDPGIGSSGSISGQVARHTTGPLIGGGVGMLLGGPAGAAAGAATGTLASAGMNAIIRRALAGAPSTSFEAAGRAVEDPRLGGFFDQLKDTGSAREQLPPWPPKGELTLADELGAGGSHNPGEGIPLSEVLSHGVEQPPAPPLTAGPMGAPKPQGIPFTRNVEHEAGGLSTHEPDLMSLLEDLRDHPAVMSQGVPEDIMTRTANNASGESPASLEAINRETRERAQGQDRFLIDPDGKMWPIRGVEGVDFRPQRGSIVVQKGIGGTPYTILDRGGLPKGHAQGLLNRALAGGNGMTLMDLLGG